MHEKEEKDIAACGAAIAALESQRGALGDAVVELATAPLRERLARLQRPSGLQHRQVTVLFADVVGSTTMALSLDVEDTQALLSAALLTMASVIETHQGRVLRFTGDGIKAAFGMDEAREDDPDRAVRAGLALLAAGRQQAAEVQRLYGIADFAVRVGVHTGDVALGVGVEADNTATGAAVNIAARMEQSAPPGTLRISHDTWNLVRGLFDCEPQPPLQVKGINAPMSTYLVRAARDRSVARVERGLQGLATPLVGRDAEMQRLLDTVSRARQARQLVALTLVGDAGLGKSRLLRELSLRLTGCNVLNLRCQPDGRLRPWGLLRSLLSVQFGVTDNDSAEAAGRKVVDGLSRCFDEHGERQAQLLGQLSGLDFGDSPHLRGLDPRSLRDQALLALRRYLQTLAAKDDALPVLVVEDLHWADEGSLDLLQHLQAHAAELPIALIMTSRPALLAQRPDWGQPEMVLRLAPLATAHGNELLYALLRRLIRVPEKLTALITERADGNPYYMEELVRRLIDDGVIVAGQPHWTVQAERLDSVRLPGTLVGLLQARLDALPADDRRAARQASIIGHVFWDDALQALDPSAAQALPALQRASVVKTHKASDFEGTAEHAFDHHLLHQVTYDSLMKSEQKLGHGAAARWLAERTQGRGAQFLAMTGEHAERAGETALAIDCFEQAGLEAQSRFANPAAQAWLRRALVMLGNTDPARCFDLLSEMQSLADTVGDRSEQDAVHREMTALLQRHPDDARQARLLHSLAMLADRRGERVDSERYCLQACALAERCGEATVAALAHGLLAWLHIVRHENEAARSHVEPGLRWAGRIKARRDRELTEARLLTLSAMVSIRMTHYDEARVTLLDVLARGEVLHSPRLQLGALDNLANLDAQAGRVDELAHWGLRMLELAEATGNLPNVVRAQFRLARAAELRNDSPTELHWCERNLPLTRAVADRLLEAHTLRRLGALRRWQGDAAAGLALYQQAQAAFRAMNETLYAFETAAYEASCEIELGRRQAARCTVTTLLEGLGAGLVAAPAHETVSLRWQCHEVLEALGDVRAAAMLEQLHADVQANVAKLAEAADRDRLIQDQPVFREVVAAYRRTRSDAQ